MPVNSFSDYFLSWRPDAEKLTRPRYLALANQLESDIRSGVLAPGAKLPPQRELADYLDINFTTVTRAYDLCREKGLIYGVTGRGTFVSPLPGGDGGGLEYDGDIIELGVVKGFENIRTPVVEAVQEVLKKGYLSRMYSHEAFSGHLHQRAAAVRYLADFGVHTDVEHTALFAGAQNVISAALLSLFTIGDSVAVDEFTYAHLIGTAHLAHLRLLPVRGDGSGMLPDNLDDCCRKQRVSGVFLMPVCANPTGITLSEERKDQLAAVAKKHRLTVIEDDNSLPEPERSLCRPMFARLPEQTVYISGSLKYLCPWLRSAAAAFPEQFRRQLLGGLFHLNIKTSVLDAEIMTELIQSGKATAVLREKHLLALRANRIFDRIFPGDGGSFSERGDLFRTVPLDKNGLTPRETEAFFESRGVRVQHSARFAVGSRNEREFLRLSLSSALSERQLRRGLGIVKISLQELKK